MDKLFKVLDHGYVQLVTSTTDNDLLVVNAARCSFDKNHETFDKEKDTKLINYLARERHLLPFRHPSITLRLYVPIFVLRQLGKHQVGMSLSEVSRRYVTGTPEFFHPEQFRLRPDNIKQGSVDDEFAQIDQEFCSDVLEDSHVYAYEAYTELLNAGCAPEQARICLPQSMYTTIVWTGTLLAWNHLYKQRTDSHAQQETQEYARAIGKIMEQVAPVSWKALNGQ